MGNLGNALAKLDKHWEALQSYQHAKQIFEELKLAHMVEICNTAIAKRNRIIAATPRRAPRIGDEPPSTRRKSSKVPRVGNSPKIYSVRQL